METDQLRNFVPKFFSTLFIDFKGGRLGMLKTLQKDGFAATMHALVFKMSRIYGKILLDFGLLFISLMYLFSAIFYLINYKFISPAMRALKSRTIFLFGVLSIFMITSLGACTASRPSSAWQDVGHARDLGKKKGNHSKRMQRRPANHR